MDRVVIKNKSGLYARPAAKFVVFAKNFAQHIMVKKGEKSASATSLIGILGLGITAGDMIRLSAKGGLTLYCG